MILLNWLPTPLPSPFVVKVDGIKDISDEETLPFALVAFANLSREEPQDDLLAVQDEV